MFDQGIAQRQPGFAVSGVFRDGVAQEIRRLFVLAAPGESIGGDHEARGEPAFGIEFAPRHDHHFTRLRGLVDHRVGRRAGLSRITVHGIAGEAEQQRRTEQHPQRAGQLEQIDREREDQRGKRDDGKPAHARFRNRRSRIAPATAISSSGMANSGQVVALTAGL